MEKQYFALAYYIFTSIDNPHLEVQKHKYFFENKDVSGRIYFSEGGINGQMSGQMEACEEYMSWLRADSRFSTISFKIHSVEQNIFPRMTVKYRQQLVALDEVVNPEEGGEHVSPQQWKEMLESGEYLILDVRNRYEWEIGHFEEATLPPIDTFREFPAYATQLSEEVDPATTKVMMYCTGGIRCELYSALLKNRGFDQVYQLSGGVIGYGLQEGNQHWKGKLFVFDDRLAIPIDGKEADPITECAYCSIPCDTYYNCANMDCNALFISCLTCLDRLKGCCQESCQEAPRVRHYERGGNRPFRRKGLLEDGKLAPKLSVPSES